MIKILFYNIKLKVREVFVKNLIEDGLEVEEDFKVCL